jgi:hypothetical protein
MIDEKRIRGCVFEAAMGKPDRWPAVLDLLRKGHKASELFPDMLSLSVCSFS